MKNEHFMDLFFVLKFVFEFLENEFIFSDFPPNFRSGEQYFY